MTPSESATAAIQTSRAARFAKQLVSHWGRHAESIESDPSGTLMHFAPHPEQGWPSSQVRVNPREDQLVITVTADDRPGLEVNCDSIASHLHRFAGTSETLVVQWLPVHLEHPR